MYGQPLAVLVPIVEADERDVLPEVSEHAAARMLREQFPHQLRFRFAVYDDQVRALRRTGHVRA